MRIQRIWIRIHNTGLCVPSEVRHLGTIPTLFDGLFFCVLLRGDTTPWGCNLKVKWKTLGGGVGGEGSNSRNAVVLWAVSGSL
jgi:hypothetical protein